MVLVMMVHAVSPFWKYSLLVVTVRVTLHPLKMAPIISTPIIVNNSNLRISLTVKSAAKVQKKPNIRKFRKKLAEDFVVF